MVGKFKNENEAYRKAVQEALDYYGHQDGYNGTISTSCGVKLDSSAPKFGTKAWEKYEDMMLEKLQKRGHCIAVEVKGKTANEIKVKRGFAGKRGIKVYYFFGWAAE
jgi:hypothetical protein